MAELKSLAKDTAIYGASSIIGKFLNYLLVPVYTISLPASSGGYGVITNMYAIVALLLVLLTFGMETGFFRFANKGDDDPNRVYSTSLLMVSSLSYFFTSLSSVFVSYCRFIRLWRTSLVFRDDAHRDCDGRHTSHSFCISAL